MRVYIHIPFCKQICSYCDFPKMYYKDDWVDKYLLALEKEIKTYYKNEIISTIYIGGGTPTSLNTKQLEKLLKLTNLFNKDNIEFTCECNIDVDLEQLKLLKKYGVNRISVGVQTINEKGLKLLNRTHSKEEVETKIKLIAKYFDNINVDLIYAYLNQTIEDVKDDLNFILRLPITHLSAYSLIIEPNTKLYIDNIPSIDEDIDFKIYEIIKETLKNNDFVHYEISNYSKLGFESKHNLGYWDNLNYYGFGLGASGYINNIRYDNTKSLTKYLNSCYRFNEYSVSKQEEIENTFILGLRKIKGINKKQFEKRFGNLKLPVIEKLIMKGDLCDDGEYIFINHDKEYIANRILMQIIGEIDEV